MGNNLAKSYKAILAFFIFITFFAGGWNNESKNPTRPDTKWRIGGKVTDTGGLILKYEDASLEDEQFIVDALKEAEIFEELISSMNDTFKFPQSVSVVFKNCGTVNAFYDPNENSISLCYELLTHFLEQFKSDESLSEQEVAESMIYATIFTFLHELGHAMVHVMDIPVTGKEEDAVDDLAAVIALEMGEAGEKIVYSAMNHFATAAANWEDEELAFWDEHSLDAQRVFNIACIIYGSDPEYYNDLVGEDGLPPERAEICPEEYAQKTRSWEKLLQDHTK